MRAWEENTDTVHRRLLRLSHSSTEDDCEGNNEDSPPFSILDFGFSILGKRETEPNSKFLLHLICLRNPKSPI
jgi:hypothetical protein